MRQLLHALIVAAVAAVVLVAGARADSWTDLRTTSAAPVELSRTAEPAPAPAPSPVLYARVVKPFGAAIRALPSSDAAAVVNARCGDTWPVLVVERGWVKLRTAGGVGWIGGSRVVVTSVPPTVDCSEARAIALNGAVTTVVPSGCATLRSRPSADAPILACVESGHTYVVLDGPFDSGTGGDWFRVTSPSTGSGWALSAYLFPS